MNHWSANPVWWKINLLARGLVWQGDVQREELVTLELPSASGRRVYCTLMTGRHPSGRELTLAQPEPDRYIVQLDDAQIEAYVQRDSVLLGQRLSTGIPLLGALYPTGSWIATGIRADGKVRTPLMSYDELEEAVRLITAARHTTGLMLAPPSTDRRTGGIGLLEPYISRLKNRTRLRIFAEIDPPRDTTWIERLYAWGADGLFIPLKSTDRAIDAATYRGKVVDALQFAAGVFPLGAVATSLDPTVGSVTDNMQLVAELMQAGVVPLLYYAQPQRDAAAFEQHIATLAQNCANVRELPERWIGGLGHLVSPRDLCCLLEHEPRSSMSFEPLYRTALGERLVTGLGNWRRSLRVTDKYSDSTDERQDISKINLH